MKKCAVILTAFLGGATVGAAAALLCAPKSGAEMQKDAMSMFREHLDYINNHIKKCKCMMGMGCDVDDEKQPQGESLTQE